MGGKPPVCPAANSRRLLVCNRDAWQLDLPCLDLPIQMAIGRVDLIEPLDATKKTELLEGLQSQSTP